MSSVRKTLATSAWGGDITGCRRHREPPRHRVGIVPRRRMWAKRKVGTDANASESRPGGHYRSSARWLPSVVSSCEANRLTWQTSSRLFRLLLCYLPATKVWLTGNLLLQSTRPIYGGGQMVLKLPVIVIWPRPIYRSAGRSKLSVPSHGHGSRGGECSIA